MYRIPDPELVSTKDKETVSDYLRTWYNLTYDTLAKRNALLYQEEFLLTHNIGIQACEDYYDTIIRELVKDNPELTEEYESLRNLRKDISHIRQEYSDTQDPDVENVYASKVNEYKKGRERQLDLMIADQETSARLDIRWRSFLEHVKQQDNIPEILKDVRQKRTDDHVLLSQLTKEYTDWGTADG